VAQKTDGCMRDSLSTLDKIVSFTGGHLTYQNTLEHLNILDYDYFFRVMDAVLQQDIASALLIFDEILQKGFEGDNFLNGWAEFLRNLLMCKEEKVLHLLEVSGNLKDRYKQLSGKISPAWLITALHLLNDTEINYRLARNKRLHVEMALIKLCYLQQAVTLVSDDQSGEVLKKKLVPDGATPQQLRAPFAQAASPRSAGKPATAASIAQNESARLTIETPAAPAAKATPAATTATPPPAAQQPVTAAAPVNTAPRPATAAPAAKPAATTGSKLTGLAAMKEALAARQQTTVVQQAIPITAGALAVYWEEFIDIFRQANKMTVVSNLQLAVVNLLAPEEIGIVSRNIVQFRFMEEEKLAISEFFKRKFNNSAIILTLQLDETQQTQDIGPAPKSSREQFQEMIDKYPLVKELKDKLNMELDF
ncbi:MAG TPA: DNA polymerase III subunit gamma/tau, partial [Chitinophaga sp.]